MSYQKTSYPALLWVSIMAALFGSLQFGYHQGVLNTAWDQLAVAFEYYDVKSWYTSVISFSYLAGASTGALGAGIIADATGPKTGLLINCFIFIVGGLVSGLSVTGKIGVLMFSVGRFLSGIGAGAASLLSPRMVAEISPVKLRGLLGTMVQFFICIGIVVSFLAGLSYDTQGSNVSPNWWRYMMFLSVVIPIIQIVILLFCPESLEWYKMKGNMEKAETVGKRILGESWVHSEAKDPLLKDQEKEELAPVSIKEVFSKKYSLFLSLGIAIVVFQQLSGINTIVMYSTTVFQEVHLDNAVIASVISGAINILGTLIATGLVERAGRKVLILISHAGMFLTLGYISILPLLPFDSESNVAAYTSFASILLYVVFFAIGSGPIPWLYLAEMMPSRIKGQAASIATCSNWMFSIVIIASFPLLLGAIGTSGSYGIYAIFNVVAFVYLVFFMVETKQIPIEEIEKKLLLEDKTSKKGGVTI